MGSKQLMMLGVFGLLGAAAMAGGVWSGYSWLGYASASLALVAAVQVQRRGKARSRGAVEAADARRCADAVRSSGWEPRAGDSPLTADAMPAADQDVEALVNQLLAQHRFALLLRPQIAVTLHADHVCRALDALDKHTSLVPTGDVLLCVWRCGQDDDTDGDLGTERVVAVQALFLDRFPVTNREFFEFVAARGYEQVGLWDADMLPAILGFVDRTGQPGPRFWQNGHYPIGEDDHPVVGVCWYEATAFARWVGKRLPSDAEWVKAAAWPVSQIGGPPAQRKFPWGDAMDRGLANVWGSGHDGPVPVHDYPNGASVGGAYQLIGNVWEWMANGFGAWTSRTHVLELPAPMKSIRGGAYDTYFDSHANCNFPSGESPLARKHNIGFRCALGTCDVIALDTGDGLLTNDESLPDKSIMCDEERVEVALT